MSESFTSASLPGSGGSPYPTPNYINPERRTWLPGFMLAWQLVSCALVIGRFYLRIRKQAGGFDWDDLLVLFGWFFGLGLTISTWIAVDQYGLDRHTWDVPPKWAVGAALTGWLAQTLFVASTVCTKLSVLLFYRRMIQETIDKKWLWALRSALFFTASYGIAVGVSYLLFCQPIEALWLAYSGTYTKPYKCFNGSLLSVIAGVLSVVSDCMAVALPCAMLNTYHLDIPRHQKVALNATFALGLLATGCGIARSYYLWKIQHSADSVWTGFELFAWSIAECQLAIICACAPSLRAFFRRYLMDRIKRTFNSVSHYASGSRAPKDETMHTSGTGTTRDSRGFCELKELERGNHIGPQQMPPAVLGGQALNGLEGPSQLHPKMKDPRDTFTGGWMKTAPITAKEAQANSAERLRGHGKAGGGPLSSHAESILTRFDDFVVDGVGQHGRRTTPPT